MSESLNTLIKQRVDGLHEARHVGVLVPWANAVVESELPRLGSDRVVWHYSRLVPTGEITALDDQFLAQLDAAVPDALRQLSKLSLSKTVIACTSYGFSSKSCLSQTNSDIFSAFDAIMAALNALEAESVVLLTPYPTEIGIREAAALEMKGISVKAAAHLNVNDEYMHISAGAIIGLLNAVPRTAVDGAKCIVLSCTGWPTLGVAPVIERLSGLPVVTSNSAIALAALL